MPGDGIGNQVLPEAIRVLEAIGFEANYVHADIGWGCWTKEGNALPERTIDLLRQHKVGLFGAITSKPKKEAEAELSPALKGQGHQYFSPIVSMRQKFNLDVCMRPCLSFPGNPLNFIRKKPAGGFEEPKVDVVVFRQNTEGLYAGVEWTNPPQAVREALSTNSKFKPFEKIAGEDLAISVRIVTRPAARRICEAAFQYARKFGYKSVTICEKPNVLRETSGMMEEVAREVQKQYSDIPLWSTNIDAQTMWLTKNPEDYGVIVASNLFGDVISDAFAGLVGGLGFAASGNIGDEVAVFEPTHGSAPKYAELDPPIVNPIAMILSAAMMLDHIGEREKAEQVRAAIAAVVAEGKVRCYDMMRIPGGAKSIGQGAASTTQMTDAILEKLASWRRRLMPAAAEASKLRRGEAGRAGSDVRSDLHVAFEERSSGGIEIDLRSRVDLYYGDSIRRQVRDVLHSLEVHNAHVTIVDEGALPFVIAARVETAVRRAGVAGKAALPEARALPTPSARDRLRRSRLYLPGNEPKYFVNAGLHGPDAVILDLEDSVHYAEKDAARLLVRNALRCVDFGAAERMVRINQLPLGLADLEEVVPQAPDLVLLPKTETAQQVSDVVGAMESIARKTGVTRPIWLMPILESALGIENAFAIATASDRIAAITLGLEDYTADLGVAKTPEGVETLYARMRVANAAHAAHVQAIDSVYGDVTDSDGLLRWGQASRALGFEGMGCIHPMQIEVIHRAFAPTVSELEKATRIVAAYEDAQAQGWAW